MRARGDSVRRENLRRPEGARTLIRRLPPPTVNPRPFAFLLFAAWCPVASAQTYTFSTLAGEPGYGSVDGTGAAARFKGPTGVAVDGTGNVYVADHDNHTIRRINPAGLVTTLAGTPGVSGATDGAGAAARFFFPHGVAVDGTGNVFVADKGNNTIRRISSAGVVTTLAGSAGATGSADGPGGAARFTAPLGLAVEAGGSIIVADSGNGTIRRVTAAGVVTTVAGSAGDFGATDGVGAAARFAGPAGVAVGPGGEIYVTDPGNGTVRRISPAGGVTTLAGTALRFGSLDGTGGEARFKGLAGIAVDRGGSVFVGDQDNGTIRRLTPAGVVTTFAGTAGNAGSADGTGGAAQFNAPSGVAVDAGGSLFVADRGNSTIRRIGSTGVVTTFAGTAGGSGSADGTGSAARFSLPNHVAVDGAGNLFVADRGNSTIRRVTAAGVVTTLAGAPGSAGSADGVGAAARFNFPASVAVDAGGSVYVADPGNNTIRRITAAGVVTTFAGATGAFGSADGTGAAARFNFPNGVAVDGAGNVFVADTGNNTIRRISPAGVVTTLAGTPGGVGSADGTGGAARFNFPISLAVDGGGNVFVADKGNSTIRRVTPGGVVTTLAGTPGTLGSADGLGSAAHFSGLAGVAVDLNGNVFVADQTASTIRRVSPDGTVSTIAGAAGVFGGADGLGGAARFNGPTGVAVDAAGNLYVADSNNHTIRKGVPVAEAPGAAASRITNLSILTSIGAPGETFSLGFVIGGAGTSGSKPLLVRSAGPALAALEVPGPLPDPRIELYAGSAVAAENDNWGTPVGAGAASSTQLRAAFAQVAAFPFADGGSRDAALIAAVSSRDNTVTVSGAGGATGAVMAELYDLSPASAVTPATPRLVNVSVRKDIGALLTIGFYLDGGTARTVLVRAVGPTLGAAPFGVPGVVADPRLELHTTVNGADTVVARNDDWSAPIGAGAAGAAQLAAAFGQVGAFALETGSRDAAILVTLPPGGYTVQVRGANEAAGVALVEVYEVP